MEYQPLEYKLRSIISLTDLPIREQRVLLSCYLQSGAMSTSIIKQEGGTDMIFNSMIDKGLLLKCECDEELKLYPVPIAILTDKHLIHNEGQKQKLKDRLDEIEQWIDYPIMKEKSTSFKTYKGESAKQWVFDLLSADWEQVFCFGDYESFITMFGIDAEREWIKERIRRGKKARVLATQDGKFAREIEKLSSTEMRECLIDPTEFTDLFIMTFPEIKTTLIAKKTGEVTFVHSRNVANNYSRIVSNSMEL